MANIQFLNPDGLGTPLAPYSNVTRVKASEFLFIAGQVGMDKSGKTPADFEGQCAQVFANTSGNSRNSARANFRACFLAAAIRPTRCSSSTAWCARSFWWK